MQYVGFVSFQASGKTAPLVAQTGVCGEPRFTPDAERLANTAAGGKGPDGRTCKFSKPVPFGLVHLEKWNTNCGRSKDRLQLAPVDSGSKCVDHPEAIRSGSKIGISRLEVLTCVPAAAPNRLSRAERADLSAARM
jgi:hypothetical protein